VAPSLSGLPAIRIPRRLAHLTPHALGGDAVRVWNMEINEFTDGPLNEKLYLRLSPKNPNHGVVEPIRAMPLDEYVEALEATLDEWHVDEN